MKIQPAKGKYLTQLGLYCGLKRRWFGLEPDFLFRKRLWKLLKYGVVLRGEGE